mmetsp:Transcript_95390/g.247025  ORF Transcript_95390/g.247025 Transcript_95390/m.247025 type:complete len:284 (+) Transcript_95390:1787-2638(+)
MPLGGVGRVDDDGRELKVLCRAILLVVLQPLAQQGEHLGVRPCMECGDEPATGAVQQADCLAVHPCRALRHDVLAVAVLLHGPKSQHAQHLLGGDLPPLRRHGLEDLRGLHVGPRAAGDHAGALGPADTCSHVLHLDTELGRELGLPQRLPHLLRVLASIVAALAALLLLRQLVVETAKNEVGLRQGRGILHSHEVQGRVSNGPTHPLQQPLLEVIHKVQGLATKFECGRNGLRLRVLLIAVVRLRAGLLSLWHILNLSILEPTEDLREGLRLVTWHDVEVCW